MICIFASMALASLAALIPQIAVFINIYEMRARFVLSELFSTAISCVFIYITMRRNGYASNRAYEKKSIKELLIPIIISVILLVLINIATNFFFSNAFSFTFTLAAFLPDFNMWGEGSIEYLLENHYFVFPLSAILQAILFAFLMLWGYNSGYKKREKERAEFIQENKPNK
jgi:hypothetical protein